MEGMIRDYQPYWDLYGKGHPHILFYENTLIDNFYTFFLIAVFYLSIFLIFKKSNLFRAYFLYSYHTIFSAIFILYVSINVNDADTFYRYSQFPYFFEEGIKIFRVGSSTISNIISFFNIFLNISFLNWNIIFGFLGFIGLCLIDITIQNIIKEEKKITKIFFTILLLIPSFHFYSSGVGKEALTVFSIGTFIFALKFNKKYLIFFALIIMLFTRVHIFVILMFCYLINIFLQLNLSIKLKIIISFISSIIFLIISSKIIAGEFFSIELLDKFYSFSELQRGYLKNFRTWYDTEDFNTIQLMIYFLFYPLILNDFSSIIDLVVVFENYLLLFVLISLFYQLFKKIRDIRIIKNLAFYLLFSSLTIFLLSHFITVYGIILRQKWIFIPVLLILLAELISLKNKKVR